MRRGFREPGGRSAQQRLEAAVELHRAGRLQEASRVYRSLAQTDPTNFHALHLGGLVSVQLGDQARGVEMLRAAIKINPGVSTAHNNCGVALLDLGRNEEALESFDRAIALQDDYFDAIINRGNTLLKLRRFDEAIDAFDKTLRLQPDHLDAVQSRGAALQGLERHREAVAAFDAVLAQRADSVDILINRGVSQLELGNHHDALASFDAALAMRADHPEARNNRGSALHRLKRFTEALESFDAAIRHRPEYHDAWSNRGGTLFALGRHDEALESYDTALRLKPDAVDVRTIRGNTCLELGRYAEALAEFDKALEIQPEYAEVHFSKATAMLLYGDYARAWSEYEWRWQAKSIKRFATRGPAGTQWTGREPVYGKTLLLQAEQGLGDTLQFVRYVSPLARMGARVVLQSPSQLARLLGEMPGVALVVPAGQPAPHHDLHCPMMSLPLAFGTTLETIPFGDEAYLQALPFEVERWGQWLAERLPGPSTEDATTSVDNRRPRVGLVWNGGFRADRPDVWAVNERRNISLTQFAAEFDLPGIDFVSLQKGDPAESELRGREREFWKLATLLNPTAELTDFADTAGLVANLDLVISVDTSTAHLAAALGKPTWILNRYDTCWRWLLERQDSPWYGSVKLYRQGIDRDWRPVLSQAANDLEQWRRAWRPPHPGAALEQTIESSVAAHLEMGRVLQALGRYKEAAAAFEQVIRRRPEDFRALEGRGEVMQAMGRAADASASFDAADVARRFSASRANAEDDRLLAAGTDGARTAPK